MAIIELKVNTEQADLLSKAVATLEEEYGAFDSITNTRSLDGLVLTTYLTSEYGLFYYDQVVITAGLQEFQVAVTDT